MRGTVGIAIQEYIYDTYLGHNMKVPGDKQHEKCQSGDADNQSSRKTSPNTQFEHKYFWMAAALSHQPDNKSKSCTIKQIFMSISGSCHPNPRKCHGKPFIALPERPTGMTYQSDNTSDNA